MYLQPIPSGTLTHLKRKLRRPSMFLQGEAVMMNSRSHFVWEFTVDWSNQVTLRKVDALRYDSFDEDIVEGDEIYAAPATHFTAERTPAALANDFAELWATKPQLVEV